METETEESPDRVDGRALRFQHRRPALLEALTEYLLDNGVSNLSLRPAAQAIGVTHATLLRHFATKDDLILEVVDSIRKGMLDRLTEELSSHHSKNISGFLRRQWQYFTTPEELRQFLLLFELVAAHGRSSAHRAEVTNALQRDLVEVIRTPLENQLHVPAEEAMTLTLLAIAQIRGLVIDLVLTADRTRADLAMEQFIALVAPRVKR